MPDRLQWSRVTSLLKQWGLLIGAPIIWRIVDTIIDRFIGSHLDRWFDDISLGQFDMDWISSGFISLLITSLIIGLIASLIVHRAQDQRDKAIERSRKLYSEFETLKQAYEQEEQTRLRKEFKFVSDKAQDREVKYKVAATVRSAFLAQADKIEKEYGDLNAKK